MTRPSCAALAAALIAIGAAACGGDAGPADVVYGETTLIVIVNPPVDDATDRDLPAPGGARADVTVSVDPDLSARTDGGGVAVLRPVVPGARTVTVSAGGAVGEVEVTIADGELIELAVALDGGGAATMAEVRYRFGGTVVDVEPDTPVGDVDAALAQSDVIVFLRGGTYVGDLAFTGSRATLFGEGPLGGRVTIDGNVTVSGSGNRIRGARITGDLAVPGSNAAITFGRVDGDVDVDGSDATLLVNTLCVGLGVSGSGAIALGNRVGC